jgi:hypothetical protein
MPSPNIEFLHLLAGEDGFHKALVFAKLDDHGPQHLRRRGVKDSSSKLHCNVLYLALMKRSYDLSEHADKEALILFLLRIGLSVLCSGVDHNGEGCLKYIDDLSPRAFAAVRNVYLREYKEKFPLEYSRQIAEMKKSEDAVAAALILTDIRTASTGGSCQNEL